jgi:hypothetical protein
MNCELCRIELEDFLYGELGEARADKVRAHLRGCAECRAVRAGLEREAEIFAAYYEQNAPEPGAEMWEAVRSRIGEEPRRAPQAAGLFGRLREWFAAGSLGTLLTPATLRQAAFAALLVMLSVGATTLYFKLKGGEPTSETVRSEPTPQPQPSPSQQPPSPHPSPSPSRLEGAPHPQIAAGGAETNRGQIAASAQTTVKRAAPQPPSEGEVINAQVARAVREYQGAVKLLERAVAKRKQELDPNAVAQYESSLALIDESIAASRRALREHPTDPTAARFLLAAYSKKVELMQEIAMR